MSRRTECGECRSLGVLVRSRVAHGKAKMGEQARAVQGLPQGQSQTASIKICQWLILQLVAAYTLGTSGSDISRGHQHQGFNKSWQGDSRTSGRREIG